MTKRLPPGTGSIKLERGRYVALLPRDLSKPPPGCTRPNDYRERLGAFSSWDEAARVLAAAVAQIRSGAVSTLGATVAEVAERAIERLHSDALRRYGSEARANRRVSTERSIVRHWLRREPWWQVPAAVVEPSEIQATIDAILRSGRTRKGAPVSSSYVRKVAQFVRLVFDEGNVRPNPAEALSLPSKKRPAVPWWSLATQLTFFRSAIDEEDRVLAGCGMGSGLRVGELLALEVDDLHLDVEDPHLIVRYGGPDHAPPKGGRIRRVELFEPGLGFFRTWMERYYRGGHLVFGGPLGGYRKAWPERFPEWSRDLEIRHATSHIMRHTYAVAMLSGTWGYEPQSLDFVSRQLGHADRATTERYYGDYEHETWRRQVRRMTGREDRPSAESAVTAAYLLGRTVGRTEPGSAITGGNEVQSPSSTPRSLNAEKDTERGASSWGARPREIELARRYLEAVAQGDPSAYRIGTELAEEVLRSALEDLDLRSAGGAA